MKWRSSGGPRDLGWMELMCGTSKILQCSNRLHSFRKWSGAGRSHGFLTSYAQSGTNVYSILPMIISALWEPAGSSTQRPRSSPNCTEGRFFLPIADEVSIPGYLREEWSMRSIEE